MKHQETVSKARRTRPGKSSIDARFAESQEIAHVGSWEWTVGADSGWWSDELYRLCGVEPQSVPPTFESYSQFVHSDDRDMVSALIGLAAGDQQPFAFEHRIVRPDGQVRTLYARGRSVQDDTGKVFRIVGT